MTDETIPNDHPRALSLRTRHRLIEGYEKGLVATAGLIAHGRGEAFDYLIGERTIPSAKQAISVAAAMISTAKHPVISVNGNVAALIAEELAELSKTANAPLEINLFYRSRERELAIAKALEDAGAENILGVDLNYRVEFPGISHLRRYVDRRGIFSADVVLVMLEDGDRTMALRARGQEVVAIDLNPLSRTPLASSVAIIDNVIRAIPLLTMEISQAKHLSDEEKRKIISNYDHIKTLKDALKVAAASPERVRAALEEVKKTIEQKKRLS